MRRIVSSLLFTLLCLGLTSAAMATGFTISTGPPETPSPVGFGPLGPLNVHNPIPAVSWDCPFVGGCNVDAISYWEFLNNGATPLPVLLDHVNLSAGAFQFAGTPGNFAEFGAPLHVTSEISMNGVTWANVFINVDTAHGSAVHVPLGTSWITLYQEINLTPLHESFWSNSGSTTIISSTLSQNPQTGAITGFPSQLAFAVMGTGTGPVVPEPGTIMMLGSGILGVAGVMRRKLFR